MFDLTAVLSVLHLPANAKRLNNTGKRIEFRGGAEIGVSVHASLNRPLLSFNIVWIAPDIKGTFTELLLCRGTME